MFKRRTSEAPRSPERGDDPVELRPPLTARRESPSLPDAPARAALGKATARDPGLKFRAAPGRPNLFPLPQQSENRRKVLVIVRRISTQQAARATLKEFVRYIRKGATELDGTRGTIFDQAEDDVVTQDFVKRSEGDGAHYRIIVNPEDGTQIADIRDYGRQVLKALDVDIGGHLDWIGAAHFNTGRPHLHFLVRAKRASGQNLTDRGYSLWANLRDKAEAVATEMLGPRAERAVSRLTMADRFTRLDKIILSATEGGRLDLGRIDSSMRHELEVRLNHLETRGWAKSVGDHAWTIPTDLHHTLVKVVQLDSRTAAVAKILAGTDNRDPERRPSPIPLSSGDRFVGSFVGSARVGQYTKGAHVAVLDLMDGRLVDVLARTASTVMCLDEVPQGAVIEMAASARRVRALDQTIAEVAARQNGTWSAALHKQERPKDWQRYIDLHQKRLEETSLDGACVALGDDQFKVPKDYCASALRLDVDRWGAADPSFSVLDARTLEDQVSAVGITWLDRLLGPGKKPTLAGPFGNAVACALLERAKRLRMMGIGSGDPFVLRQEDLHRLTKLQVKSVFEDLGREGKRVLLTPAGQRVSGTYTGRVHLAGAPLAAIEDKSSINLIPWQPGLEACRHQSLVAIVRDNGITFRSARSVERALGLG